MNIFAAALSAALLILILCGASLDTRSGRLKDESFDRGSGAALRGALATIVVVHHLSQRADFGVFTELCKNVGYLAVAVFFCLSGYGLMKRHTSTDGYAKGFLKKRLGTVLVPYILTGFLYIAAGYLLGAPYTPRAIADSFVKGDPFIQFSWYIIVIVYFYIVFYLLMRVCKRRYKTIAALAFAACVLHIILCRSLHYGAWWYNAVFAFPIGMVWALNEKRTAKAVRRRYAAVLLPSLLLFAAGAAGRQWGYAHAGETAHSTDIITLSSMLASAFFVTSLALIMMKVRLGNKALTFLGGISLEMYLTQGLFIVLLREHISNDIIYCGVSIAGTIVTAFLLSKAVSLMKKALPKGHSDKNIKRKEAING